MKVVTVKEASCWGCEEKTTVLRFFGRSGNRRMDICLWCSAASLELLTGFGLVRALRQWHAMRQTSIELKGENMRKFSIKGTKRFRHQ